LIQQEGRTKVVLKSTQDIPFMPFHCTTTDPSLAKLHAMMSDLQNFLPTPVSPVVLHATDDLQLGYTRAAVLSRAGIVTEVMYSRTIESIPPSQNWLVCLFCQSVPLTRALTITRHLRQTTKVFIRLQPAGEGSHPAFSILHASPITPNALVGWVHSGLTEAAQMLVNRFHPGSLN
jgi:hypothetical protein